MFGIEMDEKFFAELQKDCCWFTIPMFETLPDIDPSVDIMDRSIWRDDACVQRHIFAMIFGGFGYSVNLSKASLIIAVKLQQLERWEPENQSLNNPEFIRWIGLFAQYYILWGTVFAYQHDYITSAQCLMNGLKTGAINLFMPYCDFIRYVLSKVEKMPAEYAEYDGCGFSVDEPMGGIELNGGTLIASAAEMIIPSLEGNNGEIVLAYRGGQRYGNLVRMGSVKSDKFRNCIDVYEVLMVSRDGKLKKMKLYFNGYFSLQNRYTIRLPKGFRLEPSSQAAQIFKVINNHETI